MLKLSARHQIVIGFVLVLLFAATRGYHFATMQSMLPSASWAVFFLVGVYLRPTWVPALFLAVAGALDYAAVTWAGVSDFCVSPAYLALIPAYAALWFAGRWYAAHYRFKAVTLLPLAGSTLIGALLAELISSGSFYLFSERFSDPNLTQFIAREIHYFPMYLGPMVFWIALAGLIHVAVVALHSSAAKPKLSG